MSQPGLLKEASSACISCKHLKRKCDRALPECSTCVRVGRACHYYKAPLQRQGEPRSLTPESPLGSSDGGLAARRPQSDQPPTSLFGNTVLSIDPFYYNTLQKSAVEVAICRDATEILGKRDEVMAMAANYFDTLSIRMPFIWRERFNSRLQSMHTNPHADFSLLCLCIYLIVQYPPRHGQNVQSSVYAMIKGHISLLEASGFLSLEFVQARLLLSLFEMGHGLYPAALISTGACARTARALGLNKKRFGNSVSGDSDWQRAEEEKRVWWEIVNLDRFINLCTGDALFATEDPSPEDLLPVGDIEWAEDGVPRDRTTTMTTPADILVSIFARECQIAHLMGRVLRHVFEPTSDSTFHKQEYKQLEKTLMSFFTLLLQEQRAYVDYCAALSMCSCTLFLLYDSELFLNQHNEDVANHILSSIEAIATRIAEFSALLFIPLDNINLDRVSPFTFYSIYQAAAVHLRMWKLTKRKVDGERLNSLKSVLGHFNIRWRAAGIYLDALDNLDVGFPITMHSMQGASVSARGPQSQVSRPYRH